MDCSATRWTVASIFLCVCLGMPEWLSAQPVRTWSAGEQQVVQLAFTADDRQLMAFSSDGRVSFWDVASGKVVKTVEGVSDGVSQFDALSCDATRLLTGHQGSLVLIDVERRTPVLQIAATTGLGMALSQSKALIAFAQENGRFSVRDGHDGSLKWETPQDECPDTLLGLVAISPNDQILATTANRYIVKLWDMKSDTPIASFATGHVEQLCFSPDSKQVAAAGPLSALYDTATQYERPLGGGPFEKMCFSPDGTLLVGGSLTGGRLTTRRAW